MLGYFTLYGSEPLPFNHNQRDMAGLFDLSIKPTSEIVIPTRDKTVLTHGFSCPELSTLDSSFPGLPYRDKLKRLSLNEQHGVIVNIGSHPSFALLNMQAVYGLQDTKTNTSYYVFASTEDEVRSFLEAHPLRYLIYRMRPLPVVFVACEPTRHRWTSLYSKHTCLLFAFNALEQRLHGLSKA